MNTSQQPNFFFEAMVTKEQKLDSQALVLMTLL